MRHLVLVLGDQLDHQASGLDGFDPQQDRIWMAEVAEESTHVPSSKQRIAVFLSAMRHFAKELKDKKLPLDYIALDDPDNAGTLSAELSKAIKRHQPQALIMTAPGDWRVLQAIKTTAASHNLALDIREDRHFFSTVREFAAHAKGRKQLRLEYWYRELRTKTGILMKDGKPIGDAWNFDQENRDAFGKEGPPPIPAPTRFQPDAISKAVIDLVNHRFTDHPGEVSGTVSDTLMGWPVTRKEALEVLHHFIKDRLSFFGRYQDAMWTKEPWLFHSHLSVALNLKLLSAREVVEAAENAYRAGKAPLASVEGFIRQILGWREYVRGIYWLQMPEYLERNALNAQAPLPDFFWTGETEMACLRDAITQTLRTGYAHHIQRLMVTGLYALLAGIHPKEVHAWYLSVYVDAVEWVELPNTLGMSQFADGGLMASKPYAASGKYIDRMSNYCRQCRFNPSQSTGEHACPFTTLYWDFLMRHEAQLARNPRMVMQIRNLTRLDSKARAEIRKAASKLTSP
ncbi:MAG: cryptochrome/photolyase family protein [Burkholderiaceae bacterium]|nr:cryptochrome/photolyase family protein [Burkholderiaceae bacterium]